jgi:5,10-methylene-tetrahydrofolate dehydrogenase/methenyl tetrahydrofolate cyclohydrolase
MPSAVGARLSSVGAITLDGKAARDEILVDVKQRVAVLTASGRTPGLGTILVGDVHPDVGEFAGHVSPNPGGVGPLTRAFLLTNVVELAEQR